MDRLHGCGARRVADSMHTTRPLPPSPGENVRSPASDSPARGCGRPSQDQQNVLTRSSSDARFMLAPSRGADACEPVRGSGQRTRLGGDADLPIRPHLPAPHHAQAQAAARHASGAAGGHEHGEGGLEGGPGPEGLRVFPVAQGAGRVDDCPSKAGGKGGRQEGVRSGSRERGPRGEDTGAVEGLCGAQAAGGREQSLSGCLQPRHGRAPAKPAPVHMDRLEGCARVRVEAQARALLEAEQALWHAADAVEEEGFGGRGLQRVGRRV
mmetsp:Transcript_12387/g.49650  ORF Transcript_12387/g.49650 Transcript_12387/m.49650 type:complete len:267 (+) Transcript_12387:369-1169(+)